MITWHITQSRSLPPPQKKPPASAFIKSRLISCLFTLSWYIFNGWCSLQMDWCKVVDSFARFIADQFILLCQGLDRRIINNIRGRQYTLAPRVQFQITEFPCETGKQFTLQNVDDSSIHNCNTFRISLMSALLHIHKSTTSLKGPTDVWKQESSSEKLRVLAVMWNQLDILPPTPALLLAKQVHPDMAKTVPPASRRQRAQPQCKLPEERDKAQDVILASKPPPRSQSD